MHISKHLHKHAYMHVIEYLSDIKSETNARSQFFRNTRVQIRTSIKKERQRDVNNNLIYFFIVGNVYGSGSSDFCCCISATDILEGYIYFNKFRTTLYHNQCG